jgi:hypothetical protein
VSAAIGLVLLAVLVLALVGAGIWAARRRPSVAMRKKLAASACFAVAAFAAALFVQAFRHFGGSHEIGQGGSGYVCAPWWMEIDSTDGVTDGDYSGPAPACRQAAVAATPTALIEAGAVGLVAGALCAAWVYRGQRRSTRGPAGFTRLPA